MLNYHVLNMHADIRDCSVCKRRISDHYIHSQTSKPLPHPALHAEAKDDVAGVKP